MTVADIYNAKKSLNFKENNIKIYNNQKYQIDIIFTNLQDADGNIFGLNLANLISLNIEEDSRYWFKKASLTIKNPDNILEVKETPDASNYRYYKFRNDGRDLVFVTIKPVEDSTIKDSAVQIDYDVWGMNYVFSIYDKEEILTGNTTKQKELKLYLWEYEQQIFAETNLDWSTNESLPANIIPSQASDKEKLVSTGTALKFLIKKALDSSSVLTPEFSTNWDTGASKIFYSSFANSNVAYDLQYLLKKHVSSQAGNESGRDPAILSRTRFTKKWELRSYTDYFNKAIDRQAPAAGRQLGQLTVPTAGELQREILTIIYQGGAPDLQYLYSLPTSPYSSQIHKNTNFRDPVRSKITNMEIVDMSTLDSTAIMVSTPCYYNNFSDKTFSVDFENTNIENVKKFIDQNYTQKLKLLTKPETLLTLNKTKTEIRAVNNIYSFAPDEISRLADSRNLVLMGALFLNTGLNFTAPGSLIRQANTFVSVESQRTGVSDEFQNKLLGQWFVYKVVHQFTEGEYNNQITAVRLHANSNIKVSDTVT